MQQIKQENLQALLLHRKEVHTKQTKDKKRQKIKNIMGKGKGLTEKALKDEKSGSSLRKDPQRRGTVTFGMSLIHR